MSKGIKPLFGWLLKQHLHHHASRAGSSHPVLEWLLEIFVLNCADFFSLSHPQLGG
jgi:hypothetical protein